MESGLRWQNWSGRLTGEAAELGRPGGTEDVVTAVNRAVTDGRRVKVAGSGHSFSEVADPTGALSLRMDRLDRVLDVDAESGRVTVGSGITLHQLNPVLQRFGLAMENLGDIDRQTIAGATATGTHGTGAGFGSLSTQLRGMTVVLADGSVRQCSSEQHPELFAAARVGLGALGVITEVTLQCVPAYVLHSREAAMPLGQVLEELDALVDGNDHFEFFWFPHTRTALTRRWNRLPADTPLHPISSRRRQIGDGMQTIAGNALFGLAAAVPRLTPPITRAVSAVFAGPEQTDVSYKVFASRRDIRFNEGEYGIPRAAAVATLREIIGWMGTHDEKVSFPFEVRFVAPDDIPLSPGYGRASAYIAFHQFHRMPYRRFFDAMEDILGAVEGRPHWGKMHRLDASTLRPRYPRFDDFVTLRDSLDPTGVFANAYLDRVLGMAPNRVGEAR